MVTIYGFYLELFIYGINKLIYSKRGLTNTSINKISIKLQQTNLKILDDTKRCNQIIAFDKSKMYCTIHTSMNNKAEVAMVRSSNVCFGDSGYFS